MGKTIELVTAHAQYSSLGSNPELKQQFYMAPFQESLGSGLIIEIAECTLKGWILGNGRFKQQVDAQTNRLVRSSGHGGDRKSESYLSNAKSNTLAA